LADIIKNKKAGNTGKRSFSSMAKILNNEKKQIGKNYIEDIKDSLTQWADNTRWNIPICGKETSFAEMLEKEATRFGYRLHDVSRDGNCFFHAVAHQLNRQKDDFEYTHEELRESAIRELCNDPERYKEFCDEDTDGGIEQMILNSIESGSWERMSEVVPIALSRAMNISLVILRSDNADPTIYRRPPNFDGTERPIAYIANEVDWHFQSLEALEGEEAKKNRDVLKELFNKTEVDALNN
jgi:hypothetical protein